MSSDEFVCFCLAAGCHACGGESYCRAAVTCDCGAVGPALCRSCFPLFMADKALPKPHWLYSPAYLASGKGPLPPEREH